MKHIFIEGNPIDGIKFRGPFDDMHDAIAYGDWAGDGDWWIGLVNPPADDWPHASPAKPTDDESDDGTVTHTPNGYDAAWHVAINHALRDRDSSVRVCDLSDSFWEGWLAPMLDAIERRETSVVYETEGVQADGKPEKDEISDEWLRVMFTPQAIREHYEGSDCEEWVNNASDEELRKIGYEAIQHDHLWNTYGDVLNTTMPSEAWS